MFRVTGHPASNCVSSTCVPNLITFESGTCVSSYDQDIITPEDPAIFLSVLFLFQHLKWLLRDHIMLGCRKSFVRLFNFLSGAFLVNLFSFCMWEIIGATRLRHIPLMLEFVGGGFRSRRDVVAHSNFCQYLFWAL